MKPQTNVEAILNKIQSEAIEIDPDLGYINIDADISSPENKEHSIFIQGRIVATVIKHNSGNKIDGFWETPPHDYVDDYDFEGVIEIYDSEGDLVENVEYEKLITVNI